MMQEGLLDGFPGIPGSNLAPTPSTPVYIFYPPNVTRGARLDGRMSPIRRFFCLVVTFDLLLTGLIWLLTIMVTGDDWRTIYQKQIAHYNIKTSLFDTVMASSSRFVVLMSFYGVLQISHWIIVALSTAGTGAFVVAKIVFYKWNSGDLLLLSIMLVLSGFILSWTEAWLLDIKVIPQERFAESMSGPPSVYGEERNRHYGISSDLLSRSSFYSPLGSRQPSPTGSVEDSLLPNRPRRTPRMMTLSSSENDALAQKGNDLLATVWAMFNSDKWGNERETEEGCTIQSFTLDGYKVFRLKCAVSSCKRDLVRVLHHDVHEVPSWNQAIESARVIQTINATTDITCQISKDGTIISSKEYVTLRHLGEIGEYTILANVSIDWPENSSNPSVKRGRVGPGCWAIRPVCPDDPLAPCEVYWILNPQVNFVPGILVDRQVPPIMTETIRNLRCHMWRTENDGALACHNLVAI